MATFNVLNLGAGWQSSRIFLAMCAGELPMADAAVFSYTQWEPKAVYRHLRWLEAQGRKAGLKIHRVTKGDLRKDAIEFRAMRKSSDGKRFASIPLFTKNLDGSQGRIKRQCTKEYKIWPIERWIRRVFLGLRPGQRIPKDVLVRQWFGISKDEGGRATFPGQWKKTTITKEGLFGEPYTVTTRRWLPAMWKHHVYPLLNEIWKPNRTIEEYQFLPTREDRETVGEWLKARFPKRNVPRSACIGCPFRSNDEWREMRDERPDEWADACEFDDAQRVADAQSASGRKLLVGTPYVHRQLVQLRMVNLNGPGERKGAGCGTLFDGQDGLCGV